MWYNKYIGLPYKNNGRERSGLDCWGLARLIYSEQFNIELPSFVNDYDGATNKNIRELVSIQKESWNLVTKPEVPDICVFRILGQPTHIATYIGNNKFIHVSDGKTSVIESLDDPRWLKRLQGFYRYSNKQIQIVGAPHPLQTQNIVTDWVVAGKNLEELSVYIKNKYNVSDILFDRVIILVDGILIDRSQWHTRRLIEGETVAYRVLPGKEKTLRVLGTIAIIGTIGWAAPEVFTYVLGSTGSQFLASAAYVATAFAISYVGGKLLNAIAPIRQPKDPGTPGSLNLFNGTSNQANKFGAIPVVLGRVRMTGVLGAQPYIHSLENSSTISTILIWGFGPLSIQDLQIGTIPINNFYNDLTTGTLSQLAPAHIYGYPTEDQDSFNSIYGQEIQQVGASAGGPVELVNNTTLGNPWTEISLTDQVTSMALSFTFPQGCRAVNIKDGNVSTVKTDIEIQYRPSYDSNGVRNTAESTWISNGAYATPVTSNLLTNQNKTWILSIPTTIDFPETTTNPDYPTLYQWHTISISAGGRLTMSSGTPTNSATATVVPNDIKRYYYLKNFSSLTISNAPAWSGNVVYRINDSVKYGGVVYISLQNNNLNHAPTGASNFNTYWAYPNVYNDNVYPVKPIIPPGDIKLYDFCLQTGVGLINTPVDYRGVLGTNYYGLDLTVTNNTTSLATWVQSAPTTVTVALNGGKLISSTGTYQTDVTTTVFTGTSFANVTVSSSSNSNSTWSDLLISSGFWPSSNAASIELKAFATFAVDGYYTLEFAAIGSAKVYIIGSDYESPGNEGKASGIFGPIINKLVAAIATTIKPDLVAGETVPVLEINNNSLGTKFVSSVYVKKGSKAIIVTADNTNSFSINGILYPGRVGLKITYTTGGNLNAGIKATNIISIGVAGTYEQRKDPFNYTYWFYGLPKAQYDVRVRRANADTQESGDNRYFYNVQVNSLTGFSANSPINNPPGCYLAKSAIRLESTGKVNGTVDGINALVTTRTYDWNGTGWDNSNPSIPANTLSNGTAWIPDQPTNNPASLFIYVLTHCANAYAVPLSKVITDIDLLKLQEWHTFCYVKKLAYNNVLSSTQSVMDTLRDICAAGLASPVIVNGRWTVVIDRPRQYVTQYFTPHNSWGFQSTKSLPKLPDALRITIPNEAKAYQPDEFFVYREGYTETNSRIYEQVNFPGVTNKDQAIYLAKFHLAQAKLRPETYTLNVDFEHLVCTRGDLIRVSHDVPLWGIGTGRIIKIENPTTTTTKLTLSEDFYIEPNKIYIIRIRTIYGSITKTFSTPLTIGVAQYINEVIINEQLLNLSTPPEVDNLYMLGITDTLTPTTYTDSQELIVLGIEPQANATAKLTLTDYSSTLYDENYANDVYIPNITGQYTDVLIQRITQTPDIISTSSDPLYAEQISPGVYQNTLIVGIGHPSGLPAIATKIQLAIVEAAAQFNDDSLTGLYTVDKAQSSFSIPALKSNRGYKIKVRYSNATGSIVGPWSYPPVTVSITGKSSPNSLEPPPIDVLLDDHYIYITPQNYSVLDSADFKTFEYRVYRNPGSGDFWQLGTGLTDIKTVQSRGPSRINLIEFDLGTGVNPKPRLSYSGVQYRIACRTVDTNNNYSKISTLGVITVSHIGAGT